MAGPEITFLFQFGNMRDIVTVAANVLTLKSLKDLACDFINNKVVVIFTVFIFKFSINSYIKAYISDVFSFSV